MAIEKIYREAFRVVGLGGEFSHANSTGISALWAEFRRRADEISPAIPGAAFGVSQGTPESFEYIAGLPSSGGEIPVGMTAREVPAGDYTRVVHTATAADSEAEKFADALKASYARAFGEMAAAGLKMGGAVVVERYGENFNPEKMTGEMEIWIPVQAARAD